MTIRVPESRSWQASSPNSEGAAEVLGSILAAAERRYAQPPDPAKTTRPGDMTGRYLLREDYPVDTAADGSRLTFTAGGQQQAYLLPLPGGRYSLPGLDCQITFDDNAGLPLMRIRQERTIQTATRAP